MIQAKTVITAATLRQLHAVITTGRAWDPAIATHGSRAQPRPAAACPAVAAKLPVGANPPRR